MTDRRRGFTATEEQELIDDQAEQTDSTVGVEGLFEQFGTTQPSIFTTTRGVPDIDTRAFRDLNLPTPDPVALSTEQQEWAGLYASWLHNEFGIHPNEGTVRGRASALTHFPNLTDDQKALANRSMTAAVASIELGEIVPKIPGLNLERGLIESLLAASNEQIAEIDASLRATSRRLQQDDANAELMEQLLIEQAAEATGIDLDFDERLNQLGIEGPGLDAATPGAVFLDRASGRQMAWQKTTNSLVAEIEGAQFRITLDEPIGDSALDAMVAITQAIEGTKHRIATGDEVPGQQTSLGKFNEFLGVVTDPVFRLKDKIDAPLNLALDSFIPDGVPQFRTSQTIVNQRFDAMVAETRDAMAVDPDQVVILAASTLAGDGPITTSTFREADEMILAAGPDELQATANAFSPTQEDVADALAEFKDDRHSIKRGLDFTSEQLFKVAGWWEQFAQMNFISVVDFLADAGEGAASLVGVETESGEVGFDGFFSAFEWEHGSAAFRGETTAADYFNVPDEWRGLTNLAASLAGDPFTWLTLGTAGRRALFERQFVSEAGADEWLRGAGRVHLKRMEGMLGAEVGGRRSGRAAINEASVAVGNDFTLDMALALRAGNDTLDDIARHGLVDDLWAPTEGRRKLRDTASTIARMSKLGGNDLGQWLQRNLTTWTSGRSIRVAPDGAWDDVLEVMVARSTDPKGWGNNPELFAQWYDEFVDILDHNRHLRNMTALKTQYLHTVRRRLATEAQDNGLRDFWRLQREQERIQGQINLAERAGHATDDLARQLPYGPGEYEDMLGLSDEWVERWRTTTRELDDARRIARRQAVTKQREEIADFIDRLWDDWFNDHGLLTENGRRRVGEITGAVGGRGEAAGSTLREELLNVSDVSDTAAQNLRAVDALTVPGRVMSPVSPMQMVAYASRNSDAWWRRFFWDKAGPVATKVDNALRKGFIGNVLTNLFTFFRSNLDEPFLYGLSRGWTGRAARVEGVSETVGGGLRNLGHRLSGVAGGSPPDIAVPFTRQQSLPIQSLEAPTYVARSRNAIPDGIAMQVDKEGTKRAAVSLFQTLSDQPMWQRYAAQALDGNVDEFVEWWDSIGVWDSRPVKRLGTDPTRTLTESVTMRADEVLSSLDELVDGIVRQAAPNKQEAVRRAVLRTLSTGERLSDDIAAQFTHMPAFEARDSSRYGKTLDRLFGQPAAVGNGYVFEDFYEQYRYIFETRHADRMLTPQRMAEKLGLSLDESGLSVAARHLWQSSDEAMRIAREFGYFTPKQIHIQASKMAARHAEHFSYKMGAATLFGKRMSRAYPFMKAQLDFAGRYYRELTSGTAFRPTVARAIRKTGANPWALPLNLRLAGRVMDYLGTLTTLDEDKEGDVFQTLADKYTFLPSATGDSFWLQLQPGMAPMLSWGLHMLPTQGEDGEITEVGAAIRDFVAAIHPAFDYFEERSVAIPQDIEEFMNRGLGAFVFGDSSVSLRRGVESVGGQVASEIDAVTGWSTSQAWSSIFGAPPGFHTEQRIGFATALAENPNMLAGLEIADWRNMVNEITSQAYQSTAGGRGTEFLESHLRKSGISVDPDDSEFLVLYEGLVEELGWLQSFGLVDDRQFDEITRLWGQWSDGDISRTDATRLADTLSGLLFEGMDELTQSYLVVKHPELVGNMVSQWRVDPFTAPDGTFRGDRLVNRAGEAGRELRERARLEGWSFRADPENLALSMWQRYGSAVRDMRSRLWTQATGLQNYTLHESRESDRTNIGADDIVAQVLGVPPGVYTFRELHDTIEAQVGQAANNFSPYAPSAGLQLIEGSRAAETLDWLEDSAAEVGLENNPADWPGSEGEEARRLGREALDAAINNPTVPLTRSEYDAFFAPYWGELDYEAPVPPNLETLPVGRSDENYRLPADPADVVVVDGDTVAIEYDPAGRLGHQMTEALSDGPFTRFSPNAQRIRLIGVNATERNAVLESYGDDSYQRQTDALEDIVRTADTIDFVVFDPERFGTLQTVEDDEVRWLMVMYVDGQPLWDESIFTSVNPAGASLGGDGVLNLPQLLAGEAA